MPLLFGLAASLAAGFLLLPLFRLAGIFQSVRPEGPSSHYAKEGTPTMGGAIMVITAFLGLLFLEDLSKDFVSFSLIVLVGSFAFIGGMDDSLKILQKKNSGLSAWQKFAAQVFIAFAFAFLMFGGARHLFFVAWCTFVIVASANAVNLTDGLDGLAAGLLGVAFVGFGVLTPDHSLATLSFVLGGSALGFLWFNLHPAKWFMGDIGSLSMGAGLAGIALATRREWLLIILAAPFVLETLSVILQVAIYKMTKKRVFRMSPLHHHFELGGLSETQVVRRFWLAGFLCTLGAIALVARGLM